jgi:plastocyanin
MSAPIGSIRSRRHRLPLAVLAVAVSALTACGGTPAGEVSPPDSSSAEMTTEASSPSGAMSESEASDTQTIEISAKDFSFDLTEDTVAAGTYEIVLTNQGQATHDIRVEQDGDDVAASDSVAPGESTTLEVTLEEGEYVFYCSVGNHRSMGMEVTVEVTA